jgi:hypothetical protein
MVAGWFLSLEEQFVPAKRQEVHYARLLLAAT